MQYEIFLNVSLTCKIWYFDMELALLWDFLLSLPQLPTLTVWLLTNYTESWVLNPFAAPAIDLLLVILLIWSHSFRTPDLFELYWSYLYVLLLFQEAVFHFSLLYFCKRNLLLKNRIILYGLPRIFHIQLFCS